MKLPHVFFVSCLFVFTAATHAQTIKKDIPYTDAKDSNRTLDIYAPANAKDLPVVFWIHGGGWHAGDKSDVTAKPQLFMDKGFVFVSINYRLLPSVDMDTLNKDVAKAFGWVHNHIGEYGGDARRVLVGGHSAGAELAALICTDERYLKAEGVSFDTLIGCIPVDGDTYDVPAIVETEETLRRTHGQPEPKVTHRNEFGTDAKHLADFSAVTHVAKGKNIPPFLILYVGSQPTTSAQAQRLGAVLKDFGIPATLFGAKNTWHTKLNDDLGLPNDPATKAVDDFLKGLKK